jgi:hypothetical protein
MLFRVIKWCLKCDYYVNENFQEIPTFVENFEKLFCNRKSLMMMIILQSRSI